ncbi:hypothetical protein LTR17_026765 [Elasticomyces elasticus]|nr:hypothetical protein LTR17_026765 [Elasticomyces elasticus]
MASDTTPQHKAETGQGGSLFFSLPAELRNDIYELALSADSEEPIELLLACPPSNAMVTTCRQAYNEAASFYHAARLRYYSTNQFVIVAVYSTVEVRDHISSNNAFLGKENRRSVADQLTHAKSSGWDGLRNITVTIQYLSCRDIYHFLPQLGAWERRLVWPPIATGPSKQLGHATQQRV